LKDFSEFQCGITALSVMHSTLPIKDPTEKNLQIFEQHASIELLQLFNLVYFHARVHVISSKIAKLFIVLV